jgi:hypothetical protein
MRVATSSSTRRVGAAAYRRSSRPAAGPVSPRARRVAAALADRTHRGLRRAPAMQRIEYAMHSVGKKFSAFCRPALFFKITRPLSPRRCKRGSSLYHRARTLRSAADRLPRRNPVNRGAIVVRARENLKLIDRVSVLDAELRISDAAVRCFTMRSPPDRWDRGGGRPARAGGRRGGAAGA